MTLSPRQKLLGAGLAAVLVPVLAVLAGSSAAGAARLVLGAAAIIGLVAWFARARGPGGASGFRATPRLKVVQRVGLSGRAGLVLVELDGRPWLVAHGDGFAKVRAVPRPRVARPSSTPARVRDLARATDVAAPLEAPGAADLPTALPAEAARFRGSPPRRLATDAVPVVASRTSNGTLREPGDAARRRERPVPSAARDAGSLPGGRTLRPSVSATRLPMRLAELRLQDPLEDCYVASLVPPPPPSAPLGAGEPSLSRRPLAVAS